MFRLTLYYAGLNSRGNFGITAAILSIAASLQWGRDQLVAEIGVGAGGLLAAEWLQWGRDQLVAEILHDVVLRIQKLDASMGPRPIGRGNRECRPVIAADRPGFNGAATNWSRK